MARSKDSRIGKKRKWIILALTALLITAGCLVCAYLTCNGKKETAVGNVGESVVEKKATEVPSKAGAKEPTALQPVEIEKKIQQKISEKVGHAHKMPEKSKKEKKDFEDEPVGNVVNW